MDPLFIIGNGFDLYHLLPSSYQDFRKYVAALYPGYYDRIGKLYCRFNSDILWSDFENQLCQLDIPSLIRYNIDRWKMLPEHQIGNEFDTLHSDLSFLFKEWVNNLTQYPCPQLLSLPVSGLYISFNYTNTLERAYQISPNNICYIHECPAHEPINPYFGHGADRRQIDEIINFNSCLLASYNHFSSEIDLNPIMHEISNYLNDLYKDTADRIRIKSVFFDSLTREISNVYVLGHSLSWIDRAYFMEVSNRISNNATWFVSYYSSGISSCETLRNARDIYTRFRAILPNARLNLITIDDLKLKKPR